MATTFDASAILAELVERFAKLPLTQKILFPLLIAGSIGLIILVSRWSSQPEYGVLFSNLSSADSAAIIEKLKEQKIKYELQGGDTIAVSPPSAVHELRITLATDGIPMGGKVGFEIFDADNIGLTGFAERIKLNRALQGELERTISSIEGIAHVRVHITQPEKSVFSKNGSDPTASVLLKLTNKAGLDKKQITGITNLVAGSIEGLKPESVSIVDASGNLLNPPEENNEEGFGPESTRVQYQKSLEKSFADRVEQMIARVIGPGKVIAKVSAELDFSSNEKEEETYDPATQVTRSERSVVEGSGLNQRGGVPGVVSNLTNDPNLLAPPGSNPQESGRQEVLKNYEMSRSLTRSTSPRGNLLKLSAAVLVDGQYVPTTGSDGTVTQIFQPLNSEILAQIENLVKGAIGFDTTRGDTITVENIQFYSDSGKSDSFSESFTVADIVYYLWSAGTPVFILLFFFMVVRPLVKFITSPAESELSLERLLPSGFEDLERELGSERVRAEIPEDDPTVDLSQLEDLLAENSSTVKQNPQQAALLIRYWLNEGRSQ
jgi:flagellar M-ring protein FliF